jgi:hypothetical protein
MPWEETYGYAQAVRVGDTIYVSGQLSHDDAGNIIGRRSVRRRGPHPKSGIRVGDSAASEHDPHDVASCPSHAACRDPIRCAGLIRSRMTANPRR